MNPRPVKVKALPDYELLVTFQNGEQKIFDVKPLLSMPIYQPLKNTALFAKAKADGSCVYWDEDIDLCPFAASKIKNPALVLEHQSGKRKPFNHYE